MRLHDKSIVITGSTNGIGSAMARRFVAEGAEVLIHGRDRSAGEALAEELVGRSAVHVDDLTDPAAAKRIREAALSAFGKIDAVVNNAASCARSTLETTTAEFWNELMWTNLRAPMLLIQAMAADLEQTQGAVLNTGSVLAHCGVAKLLDYSISKGGLMTLTRNLALTLSTRGVRVNQMNIGWTLTENENELKRIEGEPDDWLDHVPDVLRPSGSLLQPEQIAAAAVYWVGDESRPITGSVFELDQFPVIGRVPLS